MKVNLDLWITDPYIIKAANSVCGTEPTTRQWSPPPASARRWHLTPTDACQRPPTPVNGFRWPLTPADDAQNLLTPPTPADPSRPLPNPGDPCWHLPLMLPPLKPLNKLSAACAYLSDSVGYKQVIYTVFAALENSHTDVRGCFCLCMWCYQAGSFLTFVKCFISLDQCGKCDEFWSTFSEWNENWKKPY